MTPSVTLAEKHTKRQAASNGAARRLQLAPEISPTEFLESRIQVPPLRPESISRTALVNKLRAATSTPLATIVAPPGYGKTTLLAQWAARDSRPFAWVSLDDRDNDPAVLVRHIAAALAQDEPLSQQLVAALRVTAPSIWTAALPRLSADLHARGPLVLVLDEIGALRSRDSNEAIAALVDDCADESMLVLSGRVQPRVALAPFRASGRLLEVGVEQLAFTNREAHLFLRSTDVRLSDGGMERIIERSEGWPAGLQLAGLAVRDAELPEREAIRFSGENRHLADYIHSECLSHLRPEARRFLRRTSVLERMSGSLCDAVLGEEGSARQLAKIERANVFSVALDARGTWYRYHRLLRELLRRELEEKEPELEPVLHRRAADWFEAQGDPESALNHAYAAGDTDRAAAILTEIAFPVYHSGRVETLERWFGRFELAGSVDQYPALALQGCRFHLLRGRRDDAHRWLDVAERSLGRQSLSDGSTSVRAWAAIARAWMCSTGVPQMLADAESALVKLPAESDWRPAALLARGAAHALLGDDDRADASLSEAVSSAGSRGAGETKALGLSLRALLFARRDEHAAAEELSAEAQQIATSNGLEGVAARALCDATRSRRLLRDGHWTEARAALTAARERTPLLKDAVPWLSVLVRLELAHGLVALRDRESAVALQAEVDEFVAICPASLTAQLEAMRSEIDALPETATAGTGLTPAELRLLPLLATHLSFREIGEELHVSRNTVKTQAISVYRKLGVTSRSDAISEARRLGLGDHLRVLIES